MYRPLRPGLARRGSKRIIHIISSLHDVSHVGGGRVFASLRQEIDRIVNGHFEGKEVGPFDALRPFIPLASTIVTGDFSGFAVVARSPRAAAASGSSSMGRLHEPRRGIQVACFATFCTVLAVRGTLLPHLSIFVRHSAPLFLTSDNFVFRSVPGPDRSFSALRKIWPNYWA